MSVKIMYVIVFFFFVTITSNAQSTYNEVIDTLKNYFPVSTVDQANTCSYVPYLSEKEKKIILFSNLARVDGPLFIKHILVKYAKKREITENKYVLSLQKNLQKDTELTPLEPDKILYQIAHNYAVKGGKKGWIGHKNFKKRYNKALKHFRRVGENLSYGHTKADHIAISLLIDKDIPSLSHRKNLLNKN